jgi:hypothetical protein
MPEPKTKKKDYDAQADMALNGVRIVPRPAATRRAGKDAAQPEGSQAEIEAEIPEPALVDKLINFIKAM